MSANNTLYKRESHGRTRTARINGRFSRYRLVSRRSPIHGLGVFTTESIPPRRKVIEYTGEKFPPHQLSRHVRRRTSYLFALNNYWTIDGSVAGSGAEYVNHSCEPNLYSWVVKGRILFMSRRAIHIGEELTVDYNSVAIRSRLSANVDQRSAAGRSTLANPRLNQDRIVSAANTPPLRAQLLGDAVDA